MSSIAFENARLARQRDRVQRAWIMEHVEEGSTLHLGSGHKPITEAINVDPNPDCLPWVDVVADAHALPFRDGCFKSVVSNHVIEHLVRPGPRFVSRHVCWGLEG